MRLLALIGIAILTSACHGETQESPWFTDVTETHLENDSSSRNSMDGEAVDIDGDGDMDMVIAIEFLPNVLLINDGNGKLIDESDARLPRTRHDSEDIAAADFDGDGDIDLVFVSEDDRTDEYYENVGDGYFENRRGRLPKAGISNVVEASDFNGDGHLDLIVGNAGQNEIVLNDGKGNFTSAPDMLPKGTATTQDIAIGDIDGDGDLDLVFGIETENVVLLRHEDGFSPSPDALPDHNGQTRDLDLVDIDKDGDLDLLVANVNFGGKGNPRNQLLLNNGKGKFAAANVPFTDVLSVDIAGFDLDRDGKLEIISGNRWNQDDERVFQKQKDQWREVKGALPKSDDYTFDWNFADFNGDGVLDAYLCNFRGPDKLWFGR